MPEQPNIFQVEQLERLKQELPELKSCLCPTVSRFVPSSLCGEPDILVDANGIDNGVLSVYCGDHLGHAPLILGIHFLSLSTVYAF